MMSKLSAQFNHCYSGRLSLYVGHIVKKAKAEHIHRAKHPAETCWRSLCLCCYWLYQSLCCTWTSESIIEGQKILHWCLWKSCDRMEKGLKVVGWCTVDELLIYQVFKPLHSSSSKHWWEKLNTFTVTKSWAEVHAEVHWRYLYKSIHQSILVYPFVCCSIYLHHLWSMCLVWN